MTDTQEDGPPPRSRVAIWLSVVALLIGALLAAGVIRYHMVKGATLADEAALCELMIIERLKAPSTYRRLDAIQNVTAASSPALAITDVYITFEAVNPMGVRLRYEAFCNFNSSDRAVEKRIVRAEIGGEPISNPLLLDALAERAAIDLGALRARERTPWGAMGF